MLLGCASLFAAPASAEMISQPTRVVELFSSQGCSSCPPANAAVAKLDHEDADTLALTYGVTYWDYLGWADTFGDPAFTQRQRDYDAALDSGVYTPMLVASGRTHGSRLTGPLLDGASVPQSVMLHRESGELCLSGKLPAGAKLALVTYKPGLQTVKVKRGENGGRELGVANVVTGVDYRDWTGDTVCGLRAGTGLAVLAHHPETAAVIGAARLEP